MRLIFSAESVPTAEGLQSQARLAVSERRLQAGPSFLGNLAL
jgi:hypothetical protein